MRLASPCLLPWMRETPVTMGMTRYIDVIHHDTAERKSLLELLATHAYTLLRGFDNGQEYLDRASWKQSQCVIRERGPSGEGGHQFLREVKQHWSALPVIVISGSITVGEAVAIMKAGANTILQKPFRDLELLSAIAECLAQEQARKQDQAADLQQRFRSLTGEEMAILEMMIAGQPTKSIAYQLDLSTRTVDRRRTAIHEKLHSKSLAELALLFIEWSRAENISETSQGNADPSRQEEK